MLTNELFLERDKVLRDFSVAFVTDPEAIEPELAVAFENAVGQIAARKALRMGCSGETVTEVVREVLGDFISHIADQSFIATDAPVASYLSQATQWRVLYMNARDSVRDRHEQTDTDESFIDRSISTVRRPVEEQAEWNFAVDEVQGAIDHLSQEQQQVLKLTPFYSHNEICIQLGITDSALRNRLMRARRSLREDLEVSR